MYASFKFVNKINVLKHLTINYFELIFHDNSIEVDKMNFN